VSAQLTSMQRCKEWQGGQRHHTSNTSAGVSCGSQAQQQATRGCVQGNPCLCTRAHAAARLWPTTQSRATLPAVQPSARVLACWRLLVGGRACG
jgi:hypothetical protein